jgi:hypothetical protein
MPTPKNEMFPATKDEISDMLQSIETLSKQPKVHTDEELINRVNWYFSYCIQNGVRPGLEGMALACGLNRQRLWDAQNGHFKLGDKTQEIIETAKQKLLAFHESMMLTGRINPVTGIFLSKANFGYVEKTEIEISTRSKIDNLPLEEIERRIPKNLPVDIDYNEE